MSEIQFNNLQDNIVYHSNIFNYDKQFLMNLLQFGIKLNFTEYVKVKNIQEKDINPIINYLKMKAKDQVELMTYAVYNEYGRLPEDVNAEALQKKIQDSKSATKTLRYLQNTDKLIYGVNIKSITTDNGSEFYD